MKLLIKLASLIVFSFSLQAYASVSEFETALGRELTRNERATLAELLQPKEINPLHKARLSYDSDNENERTTLLMGCLQAQFAPILSIKGLVCISDSGEVFRILILDVGILFQADVSVIAVYVEGSKNLIRDIRQPEGQNFNFDGIGISAYFLAGGQALYYKGPNQSKMIMGGVGLGMGGGITATTLPRAVVISRW